MNAYMNISVRVLSTQAQAQIKALQAQVAALEGRLAAANATAASPTGIAGARNRKSLMAYGNQIQWTGRQLQYNWTLPLLLAGAASAKFALDNEKAFTRVQKVYGDTQAAVDYFRKNQDQIPDGMNATTAAAAAQANELDALGEAFEALSTRYGVMQKDVLETAGAWAAAGASGVALAESTELSIKAAILGDMDLAKATESLIAIQSQYSLNTKQLGLTLAELNAIENQTGISMQGLIDGFSRSAGVAREAGVDVRHLGAMLAALVPATGSAATAGNALKTIISRLMSPTGDAAAVMREFGVNTRDAAWQSSTAVERLTILAGHMGDGLEEAADGGYKLSDSQKQVVASVLGSRYQMNRFLVLMREMNSEEGYYQKALDATTDRQKVFALATSELNAVLDSNPRRLQIMWATLQNGMADAIQPMIPYIIYLTQVIANAVQAFNGLPPEVQKLALISIVLLAAVGPLVRYFGSLLTLIGALMLPIKGLIGWWVRFATVTKVVDGVATTTRRTLVGMIASLIKAPFAAIASGFGRIIGTIASLAGWLIRLPAIATASSAALGGAGAIAASAWAAGTAGMVAAWRAIWLAMVAIQSAGMLTIVRNWIVGLAFMSRGASAFAGVTAVFSGVFAAISVLFSRQMFLPLILAMGRLTFALEAIWLAAWATMRYTMVTAQLAMLSAMTTFRLVFLGGWAGLYIGMAALATKGYAVMLRGYVAFSMALNTVMTAGALAMRKIWAGMHLAMAAMSAAFWTGVLRVWFAGALALPKLLVAARGSLTKIWATIIGLMRTGALAAAAAAAGPWVLAGAAIIGVIYIFRDQLQQVWSNIIAYFADSSNEMTQLVLRAWNALPQGVSNALTAVARVVQAAAMQIYEWFSYINPFARHSPSLVDNVTNGMRVVADQFGWAAGAIGGHVRGAYSDINAFGKAVAGLLNGAATFEEAQQRAKIKKFAPGALDEFNQLSSRLKLLQSDYAGLQVRLDKQQAVVDRWTDAIERANIAIDRQQDKLDALTKVQDKWQASLEAAEDRLQSFASAPIKGMGVMSDRIFENEMAQKRLRLEMMKMEDATGPLDDVKARIDALTGAQELLRGEQAALRSAGAGSEITSFYDQQIAALEKQKEKNAEASESINQMSTELEELQRRGEMLDLQNSLRFDPLTRQIEQAANAMEEMPFDRIMAGVQGAQADIAVYSDKLDIATAAVNRQAKVVDSMTAARDRLQDGLDREERKLDRIKEAYDAVAEAISAVESAMRDASGAAETMARKADEAKKGKGPGYVSPAVQNFRDAAGGNFANVGGAGIPVRTDWSDQSGAIDKFTQDIADQAAGAFSDLNPFAPIREKWNQFKAWFMSRWGELSAASKDMFSNVFDGVGVGSGVTKGIDKFRGAWRKTVDWFQSNIFDPLVSVWKLFWPSIREFFVNTWHGIKEIFKQVGPVVGEIVDEFAGMGPAFKGFWNILKPIIAFLGGGLVIGLKLLFNIAAKTIYPLLQTVGNVFENLMQIVKGAIQIVSGFFMLFAPGKFTAGLKKMGAGVYNIFAGTFGAIGQLIRGAFKTIVMAFWGIIDGIIDAALWLWDEMVGHSIIPDLINAIIWWFKKLGSLVVWVWDNFISPVLRVFGAAFDLIVKALSLWWEGVKFALGALTGISKWLWNNVLRPVFNAFERVWKKFIQPALSAWWDGVKLAWKGLKIAGKWMWDNVLKPVFDKVKDLWDKVKPVFGFWWVGIKTIWNVLKTLGRWVWDNVLSPVFDKVKDLWTKTKDSLSGWWSGIKSVWNSLKGLGNWVYENVMKPVKDKITGVWTEIKEWLTKNKDMLTGPVKGIVNTVIDAVNTIVKGLNKVADVLPGVDWEINTIQKLEVGGEIQRRANRGFKTNGARAIVGEGKANYPEFVIPTDPTYRHRAKMLLNAAASKIGGGVKEGAGNGLRNSAQMSEHGVPMYGVGGWLSDRWDDVKGVGNKLKDLGRRGVGKIMDPILNKGRETVNKVGWTPIESPPLYAINKLEEWVKGADSTVQSGIKKYAQPVGGNVAVPDVSNPNGKMIWKGGVFSNKFVAAMQKAEKLAGASVGVMQGGFRPATSYSGTSHQGDAVDFQVNNSLIRAFRRVGIAAGDRTGLGDWAPHTHAVPGPGAGYAAGSATWQWQDYMAKGGMNQPLNSAWGLKSGGVALAKHGPTLIAAGDGRYDEAVVPLPSGWRNGLIGSSDGETTININGDLVLPNIKSGDDAQEFIDNLKVLARG